MTTTVTEPAKTLEKGFVGQSIPRKEDRRLVQGQGTFFDDVRRHGMGYVHFVRSPYAHAKIVSIDVSKALELDGVYGTITGDEVAIHTDPFFEMSVEPGGNIKDYALAVGRVRHMGEPVAAVCAATRELARDAAELIEVEYDAAARPRRRGGGAEGRGRAPRRRRLERRVVRRLRLGRRRHRARRGRPRREDRQAPLPPLLVDAARVRRRARRVRQGHRRVDADVQPPDARRGSDLDGTCAPHGDRQAPLRHARHRRRLRQQDLPPPAVRRALPAGAEARPPRPVDGVAHRPAHRERARQRALVPRRRGRRHEGRHDDRLQGEGARRLRRVPALRAARLHHLGAGHAGHVRLAEHPRRLHAGLHEQVAGVAEPRLLADAAPVADRADHRHRRARARLRSRRDPEEELRAGRPDAVRDAERLLLRLGRLLRGARHGARPHRRGLDRGAPRGGGVAREAPRPRHRLDARLGDEQLRPVDAPESRAPVLGEQRGGVGEARHLRRGRRHARHGSAGAGARDDRGAGGRGHPRLLARPGERPARPRHVVQLARRASRAHTRASSRSRASAP